MPSAPRWPVEGFALAVDLLKDPFNRRSLQDYVFQIGQPAEVRNAYLAAMGINASDIESDEVPLDPLAPTPR